MIVIFHCFTNFLYNLIKSNKIIERNSSWSNFTITKLNSNIHPVAQRDAEDDIKFDPPVYKQRYERTTEVLMDEKWKNQVSQVVEFGCAEFGLFVFLKNTVPIKEISFVDIDEFLLRDCISRVYPLNADYLVNRAQQLTAKVFAGSVSDPDSRLLNKDAVIALELIEHLYPDVLEALPYNIFSFMQPKLVIITTPNADFNVLFKKIKKFRHEDHKFEWSREQFQDWATNITTRFPHYTVQFDGIGFGPEGSEDLGCCSQLAVFIRKDIICDKYKKEVIPCSCTESTCKLLDSSNSIHCYCKCINCMPTSSYGICTYNTCSKKSLFNGATEESHDDGHFYKLITMIEYPYNKDTRTEDEKIVDEIRYRVHNFGGANERYYNFDKNRSEIPLSQLMYRSIGHLESEAEMRTFLSKFNFQVEECLNQETKKIEACVIYEPEMDNSGSCSDTEASGYESDNRYTRDDTQLSDWDEGNVSWKVQAKDTDVLVNEDVKNKLHLEVGGSNKSEALYDSGYQKSPPEESPQSVSSAVNEDEIKKPNRLSNILSVFDNFDKINELDAVRKEKKFFNFSSNLPHREVMKKICQEIVKHPIAGPSRDPRRKQPRKSLSSDSDDSVDDVKSITTCILENSLNKIEIQEEEEKQRGNLIQELIQEEIAAVPAEGEAVEPVMIVENGDLANNNRDLEGNNYPQENEEDIQVQNDNAIDNLEVNNVNIDNNNEVVEVVPAPVEDQVEENIDEEPPPVANIEVAWSSREALFDANSQVDLLDDFDMDVGAVLNSIVIPSSYVVVADAGTMASPAGVLPEDDGFPNWLLQIFDEGEPIGAEDDLHDEPHFYCQGDGLGVHPSTVAINDDDDDDGNESDSDSSSSSGSVDFTTAETTNSVQEMFMPPEEQRTDNDLAVVGQHVNVVDQNASVSSTEEVFENAEESETNLIPSSCSSP